MDSRTRQGGGWTGRHFLPGHLVEAFDGEVLKGEGDESMCRFDSPLQAFRCASAALEPLEGFDEKESPLGRRFRVRQGSTQEIRS